MENTIAVITPTIGRELLENAINSVKNQILPKGWTVKHYVVFDGEEASKKYKGSLGGVVPINIPFNTGKNYYGHRILGAMSTLLLENWVCFLDDDNTYEPNHLYTLINSIAVKGLDWGYSLRKWWTINENGMGEYVCDDQYESLGPYQTVSSSEIPILIDTNCYFIKRDISRQCQQAWNMGWGADRVLAALLCINFKKFACTFQHTVNYLFDKIDPALNLPLAKPRIFLFHMTPEATEKAVAYHRLWRRFDTGDMKPVYDLKVGQYQFQVNFFMNSPFEVCDGFKLWRFAPEGSIFLFTSFDLRVFPIEALNQKWARKILYTIESPNQNYVHNWTKENLSLFDTVITYWKDVQVDSKVKLINHPFVNKLNFLAEVDDESIMDPGNRPLSIGCVLQNRPGNNFYTINNTKLQNLDFMRLEGMTWLRKKGYDVVCYGPSWKDSGLPYKETQSRFLDKEFVIDLYKNHSHIYISENTTARGYVSEKVYDALIAGCVPIYHYPYDDEYKKDLEKVSIVFTNYQEIESKIELVKYDRNNVLQVLKKYSIGPLLEVVNKEITSFLNTSKHL